MEYKELKGREEGRKELIRKFSKIIEPEQIAETLNEPVEYVLKVLSEPNEPMYVCEDSAPYTVKKKES